MAVTNISDASGAERVEGRVKWYDAGKGYGFVAAEDGGGDVLLHANCLRRSGLTHAPDGARIVLDAVRGDRGRQALVVHVLETPEAAAPPQPVAPVKPTQVLERLRSDGSWLAARVKWFDRAKGFGFANIFGDAADVFVHMETVRAAGMPDLAPGEAVALKIVDGPRGKMASEISAWEAIAVAEAARH